MVSLSHASAEVWGGHLERPRTAIALVVYGNPVLSRSGYLLLQEVEASGELLFFRDKRCSKVDPEAPFGSSSGAVNIVCKGDLALNLSSGDSFFEVMYQDVGVKLVLAAINIRLRRMD